MHRRMRFFCSREGKPNKMNSVTGLVAFSGFIVETWIWKKRTNSTPGIPGPRKQEGSSGRELGDTGNRTPHAIIPTSEGKAVFAMENAMDQQWHSEHSPSLKLWAAVKPCVHTDMHVHESVGSLHKQQSHIHLGWLIHSAQARSAFGGHLACWEKPLH